MYRSSAATAAVSTLLMMSTGTLGTYELAAASPVASHAMSANSRCPLPRFGPGKDYRPRIDPADFSPKITNPWSPFPVGRTYIYAGRDGKDKTTDIVMPSRRTRVVDGVTTRVVNDRVLTHGRVSERTSDYYAQDKCGNVWYFGEDTAELDSHGRVTTRAGSFHSGVDGAQPGVYMQAHPEIGRWFRQEWWNGRAEDRFKVVKKNQSRTEPYASYRNLLQTEEKDGLEPGVVDRKYFAPGIGSVEELTVMGAQEHLRLVDVLR